MAALLGTLLLSGCIVPCSVTRGGAGCGFLEGVQAEVRFEVLWNASQARVALEDLGFEVVRADRHGLRTEERNATTLDVFGATGPEWWFVVEFRAEERGWMSVDEAEARADALREARRGEAIRLVEAFEAGTGWDRAADPLWQPVIAVT